VLAPDSHPDTLSVTTCNPNDKGQAIKYTGSGSTAGQLINNGGLCLDAVCANTSIGCVPLSFVMCSSSKSQLFIYKSDKSFSSAASTGCVDLWDSGQGPEVGVYNCDGGSNQHWDIDGSSIKSEAGGNRCLTTGPTKPIWVYSNADSVELFVNGASQGKQQMPALGHLEWSTEWVAGQIEAVAYSKQGTVVTTKIIQTTGSPTDVKLEVELGSDGIYADRQDAALIKASIVDAQGRVVPTASNKITFEVSALGRLIGVGNGDPSCHEADKGNLRSAFNGLARAIVQALNEPGIIEVTATSDGLNSARTYVRVLLPKYPIQAV